MTPKLKYSDEFKKQIIKLHLEDGRTLIVLEKEYKVSKATMSNWVKRYQRNRIHPVLSFSPSDCLSLESLSLAD